MFQGIGLTTGLCESYCTKLFNTCKDELYIDNYIDPLTNFPSCRENSIVCTLASSYLSEAEDFCRAIGHKIDKSNNCYQGQQKVGTKYNKMPRKQSQKVDEVKEQESSSTLMVIFSWIVSWASSKNVERFFMLVIPISCIEIYNRRLYKKFDCCSKGKKRSHAPVNTRKERLEFFS